MSIRFNANEVFEMAIQIEKNGREFYRKAAELQDDPDLQHQLASLSQMEAIHEKLFARMREDLTNAPPLVDPNDEAVAYLQLLVSGEVFEQPKIGEFFSGVRTISEILEKAIGLEKDSIVFYTGIRDVVPENLGKDRIENIIREEQRHILLLSNRLKSMAGDSR